MTGAAAREADIAAIRDALGRFGRLSVSAGSVAPETDLYGVGFTSHAAVNVMLALEDAFDIEFPDELLTRATFGSIAALADAVSRTRAAA
ncbi:MAG: acyl carrier protein [Actinomycetales bacterium]|nr:acyl carrier protein [Actinomycetales bacterium]